MKLWIKVGAGATIVIGLIVVIGAYAWFEIPTTLYPSKHWKEKYQETPPVKLQLSMTNNAVDGMVSNQSDSVITSIVIHVRVREIRKCGETLANVFSDLDWEANCKKNPNHTVEDTVDGQAYECFHGELAPYNAARCYAATAMEFDPSKQIWDFFVLKVKGKPSIDMFGGRGHWYDHITDGLIALFNGLLVLATIALFISAEKSADAAKKSAEIAERALIAGQRAFISVSFDRTAIIDPETGKITAWSFTQSGTMLAIPQLGKCKTTLIFEYLMVHCLMTGIFQTYGLQIQTPTFDCQRHSELRQRALSVAKRLAFPLIKCVKSLRDLNGSTCGDGPPITTSFPKHLCM